MVKVVLLEDQIIARVGLRSILHECGDMLVVAEFANPSEFFLHYGKLLDAQLLILDISMPGMSGLDVLKELGKRNCTIPVLVLSIYPCRLYGKQAGDLGAKGYLTKDCSREELIAEIRRIVGIGDQNGKQIQTPSTDIAYAMESGFLEKLSVREREVFHALCVGQSCKEIAYDLGLSVKSVTTYKSRLMKKIGAASLNDILRIGMTIDW